MRTTGPPLAADREAAREHVDVVAVLVAQPELALVGPLAAPHALVQLQRQRLVVRVQQALPGADVRLDLVVGVAEHLLPARRVDDRVGFEIPVPDAFLRAGERQRQPFLALAQGGLDAPPLRDVAHDELNVAADAVVQPGAGDLDVLVLVRRIGTRNARLDRCRVPPRHPEIQGFAEAGAAVGMYHVEHRLAQPFVRSGCPAEPQGRGVQEGDSVVAADEDGVRRLLDQTPVLLGHHANLTAALASTPRTSHRIVETADIPESAGSEDILSPASRSRLRACSPCRPSFCPA